MHEYIFGFRFLFTDWCDDIMKKQPSAELVVHTGEELLDELLSLCNAEQLNVFESLNGSSRATLIQSLTDQAVDLAEKSLHSHDGEMMDHRSRTRIVASMQDLMRTQEAEVAEVGVTVGTLYDSKITVHITCSVVGKVYVLLLERYTTLPNFQEILGMKRVSDDNLKKKFTNILRVGVLPECPGKDEEGEFCTATHALLFVH